MIDENLRREVAKKIRVQYPLRDDELILFATHTHSGSGAVGKRLWERFIMGRFQKKIFQSVTGGIAKAALEASSQTLSVSGEYGERRIDQLIENRMDEKSNLPHRLRVLRFKNQTGEVRGELVFMAAHPTMLPSKSLELSADFPGMLSRTLEEKSPGSVAVFVNGAAADLRPHAADFPTPAERMEAYGFRLAEEAEKISFSQASFDGPWKGMIERKKLPRVKIRRGFVRVPSALGNRIFPRRSTFQAARLGSFLFLAFPGEVGSETGLDIEREARAKFFTPFIIGYANDYIGYVIPRRYYKDQTQYEAEVSFYGPKMDEFVKKHAEHFTELLLTEEEKTIAAKPGTLKRLDRLLLLKVSGGSYHRGYEEGRLLGEEIRGGARQIFHYFRSELPIPLFNRVIINALLDRAWRQMEPYVTYEEDLQMRGIADGAGLPYRVIRRIHAMPEVYPTWCSSGAYWGPATVDGRLIAIRNLDWNRQIGIHRYAAVKLHEIRGSENYVNIGYAGFAGVLSGINGRGISVGEIGAKSADETMKGVPMPFLLKRILAESTSLADAENFFTRSPLTRGYNYVIADASAKEAIAVEATAHHVSIFRDGDPKESVAAYALHVDHALFRGDPALDPAIRNLQWASGGNPKKPGPEPPADSSYEIRYRKHGELVLKNYGRIDPEAAKQIAREVAPGSNIQSVIYAFPDFWVANAQDHTRAADEEYVRLNFETLSALDREKVKT